jgi:prefoldin beta subunit
MISNNSKNNECSCKEETCKEECECEEEQKQISVDNLDEDTKRKIQELQMFEQSLQQFMMQKQAFTMELEETNLCLEELKKSKGEVFKIVGGKIVLKTDNESMQQELVHKKNLIELRLKTMDKQEQDLFQKTESLRQEIIKKISCN